MSVGQTADGDLRVSAARPIVIGNWKMNGLREQLAEIRLLAGMLEGIDLRCDVAICPPATLISSACEALEGSVVKVGGQDCHTEPAGAYTGDISAEMLRDIGAELVIVGHSERRQRHGETDAIVSAKASAAHRAGLCAVICIGESEEEREQGETLAVITRQLRESVPETAPADLTIIAYEPVWAIGSGRTPTEAEIAEVHLTVRRFLAERFGEAAAQEVRILYGGSMKPSNARSILAIDHVDGGLVGQASLQARDFLGIIAEFAPC